MTNPESVLSKSMSSNQQNVHVIAGIVELLIVAIFLSTLHRHVRRRKKVVCVLKSLSPREEVSTPGSPVQSERAPLTCHAACLPRASPSLRGEIRIEWKDGTVTPLYEGWVAECVCTAGHLRPRRMWTFYAHARWIHERVVLDCLQSDKRYAQQM